ncbi:hypothetical protein GCM10010221_56560 [Streptomyces parvus]|nr:hypothetical protein GCM10010221_56560 [Streptomyces parvus]
MPHGKAVRYRQRASIGDDRLVIDMLVGTLGPLVTGGQPTFRCRAVLGRDAPGARCPGHRCAGRRLPRVSVVTAPDRNGSL